MLTKSTSYLKTVEIRDKIGFDDSSSRYPNIDSLRLFVTRVPNFMNENDLRKIFEEFGDIYELDLLRDRKTGESKGCCFVTYFTRQAALIAQKHLNRSKNIPNMTRPMLVKVADFDTNERKLFIGMLSRKLNEEDLRLIFSFYGTIEDCIVLRDSIGISKGCAFITYREKQSALNAIKYMHRSQIMENCSAPINVRFADTHLTKKNNFAKRSCSQNSIDLGATFKCNNLSSVILFQQLVRNLNSQSDQEVPFFATQIKEFYPSAFGDTNNLQQNWYQNNLNKRVTCQNSNPFSYDSINSEDFPSKNSFFANEFCGLLGPISHNVKQIKGPANSNLFIYHLPIEFNDLDLAQLFSIFGVVLSAKIFIDKNTNMSKCFGFVSYDNEHSAKNAINAMNGFCIGNKRLKVQLKSDKY
ncbi:CUGBP Elav-like family member 2 isoform X4 [Brachionus plicatilis]|uniref:CUGBP Elav-like family member 2 isoform X4 n=1 Tax=Brachionus plicatilis TaxID=10195 RepID=A0A3M7R0L6_BRAPC|nr:CUGBP Elav-like family member 2 isoform X4 [Brachionus plicatilis]